MTAIASHRLLSSMGGGIRMITSQLNRLTCFIVLLMAVFCSVARPAVRDVSAEKIMTDSTKVHFLSGSSDIDLGLDGNGENLDEMLRKIQKISDKDSTYSILSFRVKGYASPDGSETINRQISEKRAHALFDYFAERITLPDSLTEFDYLGRNWKGLCDMVKDDHSVPRRNEVLDILKDAASGADLTTAESDRVLTRLKMLDGGEPYSYIYYYLFPSLRCSHIYVDYQKRPRREIKNPDLKKINATTVTLSADSTPAYSEVEIMETNTDAPVERPAEPDVIPKAKAPFYMDLRTNMLFDIAAVPNLGAEFYLGKNFSVLANWMYGWWDSNHRHRYWRIYGGELGARWWFGRKADAKPLSGHHLGIYSGALIFDFELGDTGYMGGKPGATLWERCLVNSGIEYGYSIPISRHLNIDFSIGLGYLGGNYIKYFPFDNDYYREKEYKMQFFGPTKAEISLVWLLGRGNTNSRKGGEK